MIFEEESKVEPCKVAFEFVNLLMNGLEGVKDGKKAHGGGRHQGAA